MNTEELSAKIAGEVVLSQHPGRTLKKWREIFGLTIGELAKDIGVSPSVISDYERGRRHSPGSKMIRKIVLALMKSGKKQILHETMHPAILDMREFPFPLRARELCKAIKGTPIANEKLLNKKIYGYTVLDSPKAILEMSSEEFLKIYGITSERAIVFTKVSSGRSPFVAIRVASIKPGMVVLHGLEEVDPLGIKIAQRENFPAVLSRMDSVDLLIRELRKW